MADAAIHIQHTLRYIAVAETLRDASPASAGEIMCLAVVQAAQASGHRQNIVSHTQTRNGIRNVVGRLPVSSRERVRLLTIANIAVTDLHGLAYHPADIERREHRTNINLARELVTTLLRYA